MEQETERALEPDQVRRIMTLGASSSAIEPPAVLCAVCREGIGTVAELAVTDAGPMHVRCRVILAPESGG